MARLTSRLMKSNPQDSTMAATTPLITDISQVTPEWLTGVLQRSGVLERGHVIGVEPDTKHLAYGSFVSRLALRFSDDTPDSAPRRLFLKFNPREAQFGIAGLGKKEP